LPSGRFASRELADQYEQLAGQVAKARLLRNSLGRFRHSAQTMDEIDQLLNRPCVPLPAAQVPLAQRNLLDDPLAQSHLTLQQLVDVMTQAFASARDAVTRYDHAMSTLKPTLDGADQQLSSLSSRAAALGVQAVATSEAIRAILRRMRRDALDDPLTVQASFSQALQSPLRSLREKLDSLERDRDSIHDDLARAQARQARAERTRGLDQARVSDLGTWLTSIARTMNDGQYAAARIGLQRWNTAAETPYATEERRQEQIDLLKALRAMAQRRRERGARIDPELDALALQADAALRATPTDVARAAALIAQYQRGVTAL
jgi:chromosome segregation ATPase